MKVILASPTYGPVDPLCARDLRVAIMSAAAHGIYWAGDASPERMPYNAARNVVARTLRQTPDAADGIVWVDSDIRMAPDAIIRLLATVETHGLDFVTGIYHARKPPNLPVIYHWDERVSKYLQCVDYPEAQIISLDACGFGFCYTSSHLINAIADGPTFTPKGGWFPDTRDSGGYGEDIAFCHQARFLTPRIQLYVDTGVQVGHVADPEVVTSATFRARAITLASPEIQSRDLNPDWGKREAV